MVLAIRPLPLADRFTGDEGACGNAYFVHGDGSKGLASKAPFDKIIVTAGAPIIPTALFEQLNENGILIIPVGDRDKQKMIKVVKRNGKMVKEELADFAFVPLLGEQGWANC